MADYTERKAAFLILFALLLQLSLSYAAQICPLDKVQTEIKIGHTREPRNLAIGQLENKIAVTIGLTALENGSKSVPLPGKNLSVTVLMPTTGADGKVKDTYVLDQQMTTDNVGEVSFEVSTSNFNPRKIKYVISAVYVPESRSIYLGSGETETYTPGTISPISLAACFPFLLVGGLLMAALFAVGKDPFAFFDFSRVAFRPPPIRARPPKAIRIEPGTLAKQAISAAKGTLALAAGAGKILSGKTPDTVKAYRAGKEAYNKTLAEAKAAGLTKKQTDMFGRPILTARSKQAELAAKEARKVAVQNAGIKAAAAPPSTAMGRKLAATKSAFASTAFGGALVIAAAWTGKKYRAAMGRSTDQEIKEDLVKKKLTNEDLAKRVAVEKKLGKETTDKLSITQLLAELRKVTPEEMKGVKPEEIQAKIRAEMRGISDLEVGAVRKKVLPMSLGGAHHEGATLISVSMSYGPSQEGKPSDVRKSSAILSARSYVEQGLTSLKLLYQMGAHSAKEGFTKEGFGNPIVMAKVPKYGVLPVHSGWLVRPGLLAKANKDWTLDDANKITKNDLKDSAQVLLKLTKQFGGDKAKAEQALPYFYRGTFGTEVSSIALQRALDDFSGVNFFPGRVASKLSKAMIEDVPEMKYVGKSLAKGKIEVAISDNERAIDTNSIAAANKEWKLKNAVTDKDLTPILNPELVKNNPGLIKDKEALKDPKNYIIPGFNKLVDQLGAEKAQEAIADFYKGSKLTPDDFKALTGAMRTPVFESQMNQLNGQFGTEQNRLDKMKTDLQNMVESRANKSEIAKQRSKVEDQNDTISSLNSEIYRLAKRRDSDISTVADQVVAVQNLRLQKELNTLESKAHDVEQKKSNAEGELAVIRGSNRLEETQNHARQANLNQIIRASDERLNGPNGLNEDIRKREELIKATAYGGENLIATGDVAEAQGMLSTKMADSSAFRSRELNKNMVGTELKTTHEKLDNIARYNISDRPGAENAITETRGVLTTISDKKWVDDTANKIGDNADNYWLKSNDLKLSDLTPKQKDDMKMYRSDMESEARNTIETTRKNLQEYSEYLSQENYAINLTPKAVIASAEPMPAVTSVAGAFTVAEKPVKSGEEGAKSFLQSTTLTEVPEKELPTWAKDLEKFLNTVGNPEEAFSGIDIKELARMRALIEKEMRKGMR